MNILTCVIEAPASKHQHANRSSNRSERGHPCPHAMRSMLNSFALRAQAAKMPALHCAPLDFVQAEPLLIQFAPSPQNQLAQEEIR
jgi:hypothetical protein